MNFVPTFSELLQEPFLLTHRQLHWFHSTSFFRPKTFSSLPYLHYLFAVIIHAHDVINVILIGEYISKQS